MGRGGFFSGLGVTTSLKVCYVRMVKCGEEVEGWGTVFGWVREWVSVRFFFSFGKDLCVGEVTDVSRVPFEGL